MSGDESIEFINTNHEVTETDEGIPYVELSHDTIPNEFKPDSIDIAPDETETLELKSSEPALKKKTKQSNAKAKVKPKSKKAKAKAKAKPKSKKAKSRKTK